jgi:hypothetical protein
VLQHACTKSAFKSNNFLSLAFIHWIICVVLFFKKKNDFVVLKQLMFVMDGYILDKNIEEKI